MTKHLLREEQRIRQRISALAMRISQQLDDALEALRHRDGNKAQAVMDLDSQVDQEEVAIEEECLKVIALHQPVTEDLRFLVTVLKVNNDLERIGDHAVNLAHIAGKLAEKSKREIPDEIIRMGRLVTQACHRCVTAFVEGDIEAAVSICHDDEAINELCELVHQEGKKLINEERGTIGHGIRIHRVGRELERIGDLCKNIAEDTIYMMTGEVVRHNRLDRLDRLDLEAARADD